jgi:hypothetical protein
MIQKNFLAVVNAVVLVNMLLAMALMASGELEPLIRLLTLLFGWVGYIVPMLIALAFSTVFIYSKPRWRLPTMLLFLAIASMLATLAGAWNMYLQTTLIPADWTVDYFTLNEKEVLNAGGYMGSVILTSILEGMVTLNPTWSTELQLVCIMSILMFSLVLSLVLLTYLVYAPKKHKLAKNKTAKNTSKVIHNYY